MSDLISRSRLIEEIKRYQMDIVSKATAMKVIRNAPTVTDTNVGGKWIPCSERLPEEGESVQVTFIGYNDRLPHCDKFAYFHDKKWFWCYAHEKVIVKIVAWIPNCEPYKGE